MKTGSTANKAGLYMSECCLKEMRFTKFQTFTRCPKCSSLTIWEPVTVKGEPPESLDDQRSAA
jgi:hypothetical protein